MDMKNVRENKKTEKPIDQREIKVTFKDTLCSNTTADYMMLGIHQIFTK